MLTDEQYLRSLVSTVALAAATTAATLFISGITGVFLTRARFRGRALLAALLTLPLAFPGVVIGFMVIMLAGRQGLIPDISERLIGERIVFAYSMAGLFLGYLYFSIPRTILTVMAAAEKLDLRLEEAARSLGAGPLRVVSDVIVPALKPALLSAGAICFATAMGAFGTAFTLATRINVLADGDLHRVHVAGECRDGGGAVVRAWCADVGGAGDGTHGGRHDGGSGGMKATSSKRRSIWFWPLLAFTIVVCAFLIVPVGMSMLAGVTRNYFIGIDSGLTLEWVIKVWTDYRHTILLSIQIALACLACTLLLGVPAAYALARANNAATRVIEELLVMPVAIPGLATALALIVTFGNWGGFRRSWLIILVGHVLFTLPFMVRSVLAVLASIDLKSLEEGARSLGANFTQRFFGIVLPNCRAGIVAGSLMVVTLSIGEFNMTLLLHTPLTPTLPVGLADAYASLRLEVGSAYTLIFFVIIIPLLIALQWASQPLNLARSAQQQRKRGDERHSDSRTPLRQDIRRWHACARADRSRNRRRRNDRAARTVGLRQDHDAAHHCGTGVAR